MIIGAIEEVQPNAVAGWIHCRTANLRDATVLAFLDGNSAPATLEATVELRPPDLLPRLRRWPAHPSCACGAASVVPRVPGSATRPGDAAPTPVGTEDPRQGTMGR